MEQIIKLLIFFALITIFINLIFSKKNKRKNKRNTNYKTNKKRKPIQERAYLREKPQKPFKQNYSNIKEDESEKDKFKETKKLEEMRKNIYKKMEIEKIKEEPQKEKSINMYDTIKPQKTKKEINEDKKIKGNIYEIFVGKYYKKQGYTIIQNGIIKGLKDDGIDVIAENENEVIFIQCKNWEINKNRIKHKDIKSFVGTIFTYTENNPKYKNKNIKRLFVASNDIFDRSAKRYCRENRNIVEYKIISM